MKVAAKDKVQKWLVLVILISLCLSLWFILSKVRLYGDDWFYYQFSRADLKYYLQKNIEHYFKANGRVVVHLLATGFLRMPMFVWQTVNLFFIVSTVIKLIDISKTSKVDKWGQILFGLLMMVFIIVTMDKAMTEQSIFWLTGSFNYMYPLWIFTWFMHRYLVKNQMKVDNKLIILGFFAAASVEQAGMMTFGLVVLILFEKKVFKKSSLTVRDLLLLIVTLIGVLTVVLAPSVFLRAAIEEKAAESTLELIFLNIEKVAITFWGSRVLISVQLFVTIASFSLFYDKWKKEGLNAVDYIFGCIGGVGTLLTYALYLNKLPYFTVNILKESSSLYYPLLLISGIGMLSFTFYLAVDMYKKSSEVVGKVPLIGIVLGLGTLMMMFVSPVFGFRNLIFVYFMFALVGMVFMQKKKSYDLLFLVALLFCFAIYEIKLLSIFLLIYLLFKGIALFIKPQLQGIIVTGTVMFVIGSLSLFLLLVMFRGFGANAKTYDENIQRASQYLSAEDNDVLTQHLLPYAGYRWAMPYENHYYDAYYNLYMGLNVKQKIEWIQ